MQISRRIVGPLVLSVVALAACGGGVTAQPADGEPPSAPAPEPAADCRFPSFFDAENRWRPTPREQKMQRHLREILAERFGENVKGDSTRELRGGLIGLALDGEARGFAAVVDPAMVDVDALERDLKAAARSLEESLRDGREIPVRAQAGCHSAPSLIEALDIVREVGRRHGESFAFSLEEHASRVTVTIPASGAAAAEMRERLGDRVSIEDGRVALG